MYKYNILFTIVLLVHVVKSNPTDYRFFNGYLSGMHRWNDPKLNDCVHWCPVLMSLTPVCASDGKTYPNISYIKCLQKCVEPLGEELKFVSQGFCENDIIHSD
ncbi:hypothetical protein WA026_023267 [Henosepilachna vigintioctopunctata]|uniref:Kazal-like domain-containing protein n=1 Tax=Henosepilachna vigintioctopunctata TaxID=420089 RepID=A0AAW1UYM9_9CUCU